jgi:hypothetical protein
MSFSLSNLKKVTLGFAGQPDNYTYDCGSDSLATVSAADYFADAINEVKDGDKIAMSTSTDGLSFSGTFRNDGTDVYIDFDRQLWLQGQITDVSTASSSFINCPAGVITQVGGCLDTAITVASAVITFELATVAITSASLTFTTAMAAGAAVLATPTALNILTSAGTIEIVSDGGSTTASRGNFFIKMICPAQI